MGSRRPRRAATDGLAVRRTPAALHARQRRSARTARMYALPWSRPGSDPYQGRRSPPFPCTATRRVAQPGRQAPGREFPTHAGGAPDRRVRCSTRAPTPGAGVRAGARAAPHHRFERAGERAVQEGTFRSAVGSRGPIAQSRPPPDEREPSKTSTPDAGDSEHSTVVDMQPNTFHRRSKHMNAAAVTPPMSRRDNAFTRRSPSCTRRRPDAGSAGVGSPGQAAGAEAFDTR